MSKRGNGNYANASYQSRSKSGRDSFTVGNCLLWPGNAVSTWWVRFISRYNKMIYQMSPHLNYLTSESFEFLSVCLLPFLKEPPRKGKSLGLDVCKMSCTKKVCAGQWKEAEISNVKQSLWLKWLKFWKAKNSTSKSCLVHQQLITAIVFIPSAQESLSTVQKTTKAPKLKSFDVICMHSQLCSLKKVACLLIKFVSLPFGQWLEVMQTSATGWSTHSDQIWRSA